MFKEDLKSSPSELLYGGVLRLPNEYFTISENTVEPSEFLQKLRKYFNLLRPTPVSHHSKNKMFVLKNLDDCSHVFLRTDAVRQPLETPYTGPYEVIQRLSDRVFTIRIKDKDVNISADRLKPAFILNEPPEIQSNQTQTNEEQPASTSKCSTQNSTPRAISFQSDPDFVTGEGVDVAAPSTYTCNNRISGNSGRKNDRRKQVLKPRVVFATSAAF